MRHTFNEAVYQQHSCIALCPDGNFLIIGNLKRQLCVWDIGTGELRHTLTGHTNFITSVAIHTDGRTIVSSSNDGSIRLWDLQTGQCLHVLYPKGPYAGMDISGVTGITAAQRTALKSLGAVDDAADDR